MKLPYGQFVNTDVLKLFPRATVQGVVIDEYCACGHLRSNHAGLAPIAGHGHCAQVPCDCQKFTWTRNMYHKGTTRRTRKQRGSALTPVIAILTAFTTALVLLGQSGLLHTVVAEFARLGVR